MIARVNKKEMGEKDKVKKEYRDGRSKVGGKEGGEREKEESQKERKLGRRKEKVRQGSLGNGR